jgi:hypothetical protein
MAAARKPEVMEPDYRMDGLRLPGA